MTLASDDPSEPAQAPRDPASPIASVKTAAYARFQQALMDGELRPGQVVSQRDMVALMGLSIGALRELLPRLEAEQLLTVMPKRGIQITQIDLPMIRAAFQMRAALEREAVLVAVERMPDAQIDRLEAEHRAILDRLDAGGGEEVLAEGQALDRAFHRALLGLTGNELLINAYEVNDIRIRLINLDRITLNRRALPSAFGDHLAVIEALRLRDAARAVRAIEAHIRNARSRAIEL